VMFAALASQKNHMAVYLTCTYGSPDHAKWFREAWAKTGKKLDMGKSCVRFKKLENVALDVIGQSIARVSMTKFLDGYTSALKANADAKAAKKPAVKKVKK